MYIDLILNLSLLVSISIVSDFIEQRCPKRTPTGSILQGLVFGGAAVLGMLRPLDMGSGLIFDGRSVMVSLCALFFGPVAGCIAAVMTISLRLLLGGTGTTMGVLVILSSTAIGLVAGYCLRPDANPPSMTGLYGFGLAVHLAMLAMTFSLPYGTRAAVLARIGPPVMLLYPLATVLVGKIISTQIQALKNLDALSQARQNLAITLQSIGDAVITTDLQSRVLFMNPVAETLTGWPFGAAAGRPIAEVLPLLNEETRQAVDNPAVRVMREGQTVGLANHTVLITRSGREVPIADSGAPIRAEGGQITGAVMVFRDQSEERLSRRLTETRLKLITFAQEHGLAEILRLALDEVGGLVSSPIGFYHFIEEDQQTISLQQWSTMTLDKFCRAEGRGTHYSIDDAGVWMDCVRQGKAVIHNDYNSLPDRKGLPEGHAPLVRELVVPVARGGKLVAILGIGNKPDDYTEKDLQIAAYLADVTWEIVARKKAEDALAKSEALVRRVLSAAPVGIFVMKDRKYESANRYWCENFGYPEETILGKTTRMLYETEEEYVRVGQDLYGDLAQKGIASTETSLKRSDGSLRDVIVSAAPIDPDRPSGQVVALVHDITERKKAEETLRLNESRLDAMVALGRMTSASLTDIYAFVIEKAVELTGSKIGYLAFTNEDESVLTMQSWSRSAMKECRIQDKPLVYPVESTGLWGEPIRQRRPVITNDYTAASQYQRGYPEGHVQVLRHMGIPVFDGPRIVAVAGVGNKEAEYNAGDVRQMTLLMDGMWKIVQRRKAEDALRESEEKFRLTFYSSPDAISINRLEDSLWVDTNEGFTNLTGFTKDDLIGKTSLDINIWNDPEDRKRVRKELKEKGFCQNFEAEFRKKDGTVVTGFMSARVINLENVPHIISITRDITAIKEAEEERKRLEEQLIQAQKMESVGRLAGGIAHDFNNMLGVILGRVELALLRLDPGDRLHGHLLDIQKAAGRSADLTRQLLGFARRQTAAPKVLDLNDNISGMLKMLRMLIGEDIDLAWLPGLDLQPVKMDPSQLDQILANLCVNARDAIEDVGKITIETHNTVISHECCEDKPYMAPGNYVSLSVSDTGRGLEKDVIDKIFEPFFTTKEVGKGTGLGLATVYGIVKQNEGYINVYSEPGKGTTFKIYLPAHGDRVEEEPSSDGEEDIKGGSVTVLLVEDEPMLLEMGEMMLKRLGYEVLTAQGPGAAIEIANNYEEEIALLITDVVMPEMNGKDLSQRISSLRPGIKCLFTSGYTSNAIARHGVLDQGVHFIQKPFQLGRLAKGVQKALES